MPASLVVPYRNFGLGGVRPYLVLLVTGVNGRSGSIAGLIDSGADNTVLPAGYAPLMGYTAAGLEAEQGNQVSGSVTLRHAIEPSQAYVPQIADLVFPIKPCFVQGCQIALWGRADLMQHFDITIMERAQQFTLTRCEG